MKKTTIREYDKEGNIAKETIVEETEWAPVMPYPVIPIYPPIYTTSPTIQPWNDGKIIITCDSSQKG